MKLLFVVHAIVGGGAERVMVTLMNSFVEKGYDVSLLTNINRKSAYEYSPNIKLYDLVEGYPKESLGTLNKVKKYLRKLSNIRKTVKRVSPDVTISFLSDMNCDVIAATLLTRTKIICSEHTNVLYKHPLKLRFLRRILYPFASSVTVLTRHDYYLWKNRYKNCVYMPNPVILSNDKDATKELIVLAAGRLSAWYIKGFDNLLKSWGCICKKHPTWQLMIAGDGDEKSFDLLHKIATDNYCINYSFLGFRKDISDIMRRASVFCLSSRLEGLPMVLIEAMNSKCCCVAFDCITGPNEIITNEVNGVLVENQNTHELSKQLHKVMSDAKLRYRFAQNAPKAVKKYSVERVLRRWEILFNKLTVCAI